MTRVVVSGSMLTSIGSSFFLSGLATCFSSFFFALPVGLIRAVSPPLSPVVSPITANQNDRLLFPGAPCSIATPSPRNRFCQMKIENEVWPRKFIPGSENRRATRPRPSARSYKTSR